MDPINKLRGVVKVDDLTILTAEKLKQDSKVLVPGSHNGKPVSIDLSKIVKGDQVKVKVAEVKSLMAKKCLIPGATYILYDFISYTYPAGNRNRTSNTNVDVLGKDYLQITPVLTAISTSELSPTGYLQEYPNIEIGFLLDPTKVAYYNNRLPDKAKLMGVITFMHDKVSNVMCMFDFINAVVTTRGYHTAPFSTTDKTNYPSFFYRAALAVYDEHETNSLSVYLSKIGLSSIASSYKTLSYKYLKSLTKSEIPTVNLRYGHKYYGSSAGYVLKSEFVRGSVTGVTDSGQIGPRLSPGVGTSQGTIIDGGFLDKDKDVLDEYVLERIELNTEYYYLYRKMLGYSNGVTSSSNIFIDKSIIASATDFRRSNVPAVIIGDVKTYSYYYSTTESKYLKNEKANNLLGPVMDNLSIKNSEFIYISNQEVTEANNKVIISSYASRPSITINNSHFIYLNKVEGDCYIDHSAFITSLIIRDADLRKCFFTSVGELITSNLKDISNLRIRVVSASSLENCYGIVGTIGDSFIINSEFSEVGTTGTTKLSTDYGYCTCPVSHIISSKVSQVSNLFNNISISIAVGLDDCNISRVNNLRLGIFSTLPSNFQATEMTTTYNISKWSEVTSSNPSNVSSGQVATKISGMDGKHIILSKVNIQSLGASFILGLGKIYAPARGSITNLWYSEPADLLVNGATKVTENVDTSIGYKFYQGFRSLGGSNGLSGVYTAVYPLNVSFEITENLASFEDEE